MRTKNSIVTILLIFVVLIGHLAAADLSNRAIGLPPRGNGNGNNNGAINNGAPSLSGGFTEYMGNLVEGGGSPKKLGAGETATTKQTFKPPVEILIEAKTSATDLRISYAAGEVIFNWQNKPTELRIGGGPANGQHKPGAGTIPANKYMAIRWIVLPTKQSIFVDGKLRYEHVGDYSTMDCPVSVFGCPVGHGKSSDVTVRTIKVKQIIEPLITNLEESKK